MKTPQQKPWQYLPSVRWLPTFFLIASIGAFAPPTFIANASEASAEDDANPALTANTTGDYHLAPGDNLTIVVFDQPQLSGDFIVDGGGGVLLPLVGSVSVEGLTLPEAQQLIQDRLADGVLVQPAVSVRIKEYRPIFVTGSVRKPGSYNFILGETVKAAIATAGGEGLAIEQSPSVAASDFITAEQHVRQLETDQAILVVRKARLEAQRDGRENFVMPILVGLNGRNVGFDRAYSAENDTFSRLSVAYRRQSEALEAQRPRIETETNAVNDQIARQKEHLDLVNTHLADLQVLYGKGLLRKEVLLNQQIEKALVESQLSYLEAQVAHLRQATGELDFKLGDLKATYERQTLAELQDTSQRLIEIENSIGPAHKILEVKAQEAGSDSDEADHTFFISRVHDGRVVTVEANVDTMLSPGDVVEVKLKRHDSPGLPSVSTQAMQSLDPTSVVAGKSR